MSEEKKLTIIDAEEYFEQECRPLLDELRNKCFLGHVPCFFTAVVKNDSEGTKYVSDGYMTGSSNINLKEDHIKNHLLVAAGCIAKPPREIIEVSVDDFDMLDDSTF